MDKVVEISEIMQSKEKCQRSRRYGNSRKFTDRSVVVPVMQERQCQPSAPSPGRAEEVPTTGAKDAKMQKTVQVH